MSDQGTYPNPAQGYYQGPPASAAAGQDNTAAGGGKPNAPKKNQPGFMDNLLACLPCGRPAEAKNDAS
uniref:Cysteine-rich transmembrane CYSTM domain-containing protein n=1 Tax=Oryza punctata TaxID=4537 RepID=A0A0E0LZ47_ORYPU